MIHYNLAKIQTNNKGVVYLAPIRERLGTTKSYQKVLNRLLRRMWREVKENAIPDYSNYRKLRDHSIVQDDESESEGWFISLTRLTFELQRIAKGLVDELIKKEGDRHTDAFINAAKSRLGIDLRAVVDNEDIEEILKQHVSRNAALIMSLTDETIRRVEQAVYTAKISGKSVKELSEDLQKQFKLSNGRASLIARDQTSKLNSDLNRIRQTQAGIKEYVWSTSKDERVRARHRRLNGETYKWGESTGAEQGLPPGQPIQCRCVSIGVVKF